MKTLLINRITFLIILMFGWMTVKGQQQMEVPGDNFSLEGALEVFKKSRSPEEFERNLNDPDTRVNNLDLNGDGYIDYIRVIDMVERNVHVFVLQAVISENENQDIAVITLEKLADGRATLQITGDADIYGVETIIEPTTEVRTYAGVNTSRVVVNVWPWPLVRYIYGPYYSVWVSPWAWSYRPYWWRPWRPILYYDYYTYWGPYRSYYSFCYSYRVGYFHRIYWPHRTTSVIVYNRHHHSIREYRSRYIDREGHYQPRESRYSSRQVNTVRYNPDGRMITDSNARISSRSASRNSINQSRSTVRAESGNTIQRSSNNSRGYSDNYNARRSTVRTNSDPNLRRSDGSSNVQRSTRSSSGNTNMRISSGNSSIQRSDAGSSGGANYRRSDSGANIQRSSGRSSGSANIQRSQPRSGSNSTLGHSSGGSNARISNSRSSGNSVTRSAPRSSSISRSAGNRSSIQGSSSRSSGSSHSSRSSSSSSRSSGNSNNSSRGRH